MRRWVLIGALLVVAPIIASLPLLSVTAPRDTSQEVLLRIAAEGAVELWQGADEHTQTRQPFAAPGFDLEDERRSSQTLDRLRARLRELTDSAGRSNRGLSGLSIRIEAAPRTPIRFVTWIIQVGADQDIMIGKYRLSTRGRLESTEVTLPLDARPSIELQEIQMAIRITGIEFDGGRWLDFTLSAVENIELEDDEWLPWRDWGIQGSHSMVDDDGTPGVIASFVNDLRRMRALAPDQAEIVVALDSPEDRFVVPARTIIDMIGAINEVEGLRLELGGRTPPRVAGGGR